MYCDNCAKIKNADSWSLGESEDTHWNIKGRSSGQSLSGRIPEASSEMVSQSFLEMDLEFSV